MFIRLAEGNSFVGGVFADNRKNGVYFDRARTEQAWTCASGTRFEGVTVRGSGLYGAWLNFECADNRFVASQLIDNKQGCFGGREESGAARTPPASARRPSAPSRRSPAPTRAEVGRARALSLSRSARTSLAAWRPRRRRRR
jgi:hypothetical protein